MAVLKSPTSAWVIGIIFSMALAIAGNLDPASASRLTSMPTLASDHKSSQAPTMKEEMILKLSRAGSGNATSEQSDTHVEGSFTGIQNIGVDPLKALVYGGWKVTNQVGETINAHCTDTRKVDMDQPQFMPGNYFTQVFPVSHKTLVWYCNFFWNTVPVDKDGSIIVWAYNGRSYLHSCDRDCEWEVRKEGFFLKNWSDGQFYHKAGWRVHHLV